MTSPWLSVPLEDYEAHMSSEGVQQLPALADLFKHSLERCMPESLAVLGLAGGNGLEHIDSIITKRIVGVDINRPYLDAVKRRFETIPGMEFCCCDLRCSDLHLDPVALVHAALIFEHTGLDRALDNAISLVAPGGKLSVVLQLPSENGHAVAGTGYVSMQRLEQDFALVDVNEFQRLLATKQFHLIGQVCRMVPAGKVMWLGIFAKSQ
jgi:SAM-dependent methyltransferase